MNGSVGNEHPTVLQIADYESELMTFVITSLSATRSKCRLIAALLLAD